MWALRLHRLHIGGGQKEYRVFMAQDTSAKARLCCQHHTDYMFGYRLRSLINSISHMKWMTMMGVVAPSDRGLGSE